jgi:biotin carboxylase
MTLVFIEADPSWHSTIQLAKKYNYKVICIFSELYYDYYFEQINSLSIESIYKDKKITRYSLKKNLDKILINEHVDGIFTSIDGLLDDVSFVAKKLQLNFTTYSAVKHFRNKWETRKLLDKLKLDNIQFRKINSFREIDDISNQLKFPFIIKPIYGQGSIGCYIVFNKDEIETSKEFIKNFTKTINTYIDNGNKGFLCEEYIETSEIYSVEVAVVGNKYYDLFYAKGQCITNKSCIGAGNTLPIKLSEEITKKTKILFEQLFDYTNPQTGIFDIEFKIKNGHPILLEVNPRKMGGEMIRAFNMSSNIAFEEILLNVYTKGKHKLNSKIIYEKTILIKKIVARKDIMFNNQTYLISYLKKIPQEITFINYKLFPNIEIRKNDLIARFLFEDNKKNTQIIKEIICELNVLFNDNIYPLVLYN